MAFFRSGFTLVELSIVLVIIGLLIGGILGGQELIRSSELNAVGAEYNSYRTAMNAFKLKYNALPGDMANATSYWGAAGACPAAGTGTQTCNGNNNGIIELNNEAYRAWQHLNISGILPGNLTGAHTGGASVLNVNTPESKIKGAGWGYWNGTSMWGITTGERNSFMYGGVTATTVPVNGTALTPGETKIIDIKLDDGRSSTGKMMTGIGGCVTGITSSDDYALSTTTNICSFNITF